MTLSLSRVQLFKQMCEAIAMPGDEGTMSKIMKESMEGFADEILFDKLGSIVAHKKSKNPLAPKVMVIGHMDEVGLKITKLNEDGSLNFQNVGYWSQVLLGQRVLVKASDGKIIDGCINSIAAHLITPEIRSSPFPVDKMVIDVGCRDIEELKALNIERYNSAVVRGDFVELNGGKRFLSKAFDNRYGCMMAIEVLQSLKDVELDIDLYIGASVQEEVGLRGAKTLTHLIKPDFAIVLDCSAADDIGPMSNKFGCLGKGLLVRVSDGGMIAFPELVDWQVELCKKNDIPFQYFISPGGTDAGVIHTSFEGILTLTNCICARSIHSNSSVIDVEDYEAARKFLNIALKTLNHGEINRLKTLKR